MTVGDRIKELRKNKDIAQVEMAEAIGVSKQTMYKYENNIVTNIPSDVIERIAKVLNVSESYLMGWDGPLEQTKKEFRHTKLSILTEIFEATDDIGQDMIVENAKLIARVHPRKDEPLLNAAHERTDIKVTDEMRKHDEDIMDDDNF